MSHVTAGRPLTTFEKATLDRLRAAEARVAELETAAGDYFREFDHLIGPDDYPERAALRVALKERGDEPRRQRAARRRLWLLGGRWLSL